jgi:hypothetical protein
MSKRPFVVNLFAGPGAGKSTVAAGVFEELKWQGVEVELVREFAKDLVWAKHWTAMNNQFVVSGEQIYRQEILKDQVDVIVTDSPILLGMFYNCPQPLKDALEETFWSQNNLNYMLERVKPYNPKGRRQSEESARAVDLQIWDYFAADSKREGALIHLQAGREAKHVIVERVLKELQKVNLNG